MSQDTRMDKVEESLTPKQAVVLWLQKIQPYQNLIDYVHYLQGQPESAAPITRITGQIDRTVREGMRGRRRKLWKPQYAGQ